MANIQNLSSEILVEIFSHYVQSEGHEAFSRNIPRVCKDWNELSTKTTLWRDVRARDWNYLLNVSRRGLLCHTQSLKVVYYTDNSYSDMKLSAVLKNIQDLKALDLKGKAVGSDTVMIVTERCPHLESLCLQGLGSSSMKWHGWDQFLTVCGPTLKHLDLKYIWNYYSLDAGQQLATGLAAKCPLLERLAFFSLYHVPFPILKLQSGCPRLRELEFRCCELNTDERNYFLDCGFRNLKKFTAFSCYFIGVGLYALLKDSVELEDLELVYNYDLVLSRISEIPSEKVKTLDIRLRDPDKNLKELRDAVWKWRYTLSHLNLAHCSCDVTCVLQGLFHDNPSPRLESLSIGKNIDPFFFEKFIRKCKNLIRLKINLEEYEGRVQINKSLGYFMKRRKY